MLYEFLKNNRDRILCETRRKTVGISEDKPTTEESERGLPEFYDHLVKEMSSDSLSELKKSPADHPPSSSRHGRELSRLGYTVSQVVHGYGVLCQAITEMAETSNISITAKEFSILNLNLDVGIADAVTGFTEASPAGTDTAKNMGILIHELRNALAAAIIAHAMVKKGIVGTSGSTNALLERNLNRMRDILDRSFSEVRMINEIESDMRPLRLIEIVEEVEATAGEQARLRGLHIAVAVDPHLQVQGDPHYLVSAVANLVHNAIKYSNRDGVIQLRSRATDTHAVLEVEDQCGGLPEGKAEELFQPFIQKNTDRSGLGLGLSISRQAVARNGGSLSVRDLPGKGCIFSISLPKMPADGLGAGAGGAPGHLQR